MKLFLSSLVFLATIFFFSFSHAQLQGPYALSKVELQWQWTKGVPPNDGMVAEFLVKCGDTQAGVYTQIVKVVSKERKIAANKILTHSGDWWCVVTASNVDGESGPTNEVNFTGEARASGPTGLVVVVGP